MVATLASPNEQIERTVPECLVLELRADDGITVKFAGPVVDEGGKVHPEVYHIFSRLPGFAGIISTTLNTVCVDYSEDPHGAFLVLRRQLQPRDRSRRCAQ